MRKQRPRLKHRPEPPLPLPHNNEPYNKDLTDTGLPAFLCYSYFPRLFSGVQSNFKPAD
jgi:hypothetical protein